MSLQTAPDPSRDAVESEAVIRRLFERVYSTGDLSLVTELVASDFTGYSVETDDAYLGPDGMKQHVSRVRAAFHGFTVEVNDLQVEDDAFTVHWTARGTHERPFIGIEPTCTIGPPGEEPHGNRIVVTGVASGVLTNAGIKELDMRWDGGALRRQLGEAERQSDPEEDRGESVLSVRLNSK